MQTEFAENTFDHPFIVTTFAQFFETLVSNRNSTLLKLPNFKNRIFLLDEIQALPPRLYIFFSAWLDGFCRENNAYAILSTATMPRLDFPHQKAFLQDERRPELLFKEYMSHLPVELCSPQKYFSQNVFNRYRIHLIKNSNFTLEQLAKHIQDQDRSCLIILNTISDTKKLFSLLQNDANVLLMNTHFIPIDRLEKIRISKEALGRDKKIILISTQMIEAGVDIDFPIVYRDLCPLPSLIQSAGRCNRNKTSQFGTVYFFQLRNMNSRPSSEIVYNKDAANFLKFCNQQISKDIEEKDLFQIQSSFFEYIKTNLSIGDFEYGFDQKANMIECVNKAQFETLGKFKLINSIKMGKQYQYYIPENRSDDNYDKLVELMKQSYGEISYESRSVFKLKIALQLKKMSDRLITVRINLNKNQVAPLFSNPEECFGIRVLADLDKYSCETGLDLGTDNLFI